MVAAKETHCPIRMCSICRERMPKVALNRFIHAFEGARPMPDQKQQAPGRGIYVCNSARCLEAFSRRTVKRKVKGQEI